MKKSSLILFLAVTLFSKLSFAQSPYSTDGDNTFNSNAIHTVNLYFTDPNFWDSLMAYHATDECYLGAVDIDGTYFDSVCVQLKGNSSFNSLPGVKKSIKIQFDEYVSQKFDGLKTINLNNSFKDPTMMREKLMNDFLNAHGIPAPRCTYANVYINGTLWGFYAICEQVNKTFLTYRFGDNDGNLFKGDPHGDLKWKGSSASLYYNDYELKTNETLNDWSDLVHLLDELNNTPTANFHDSLETVLNTDFAIKAWAANNMFVNLDSYLGSGHNYYIYHDTITNKFNWIAWDVNEAFGNFNMGMSLTQIKNLSLTYISSPATSRPLINKMLQNVPYKTAYLDYLYQWIAYDFSPAYFYPKIDSIANVIRPYVYADPNKQFTNANFDFNIDHDMGNIPGLKDFITDRSASIIQQLVALGYTSAGISNQFNPLINIYPNPVTDNIIISNLDVKKNYTISLMDITGKKLISVQSSNNTQLIISRKNIASGIYVIEINDQTTVSEKLKIILQ
ncbi:MAG: CotH kinase family protein [Bacteroidia bacterium]